MQFALFHESVVHAEATPDLTDYKSPDGSLVFDVRDVSKVDGIAVGWIANADGTYTAPPYAENSPTIIPDRCSKLGLKRALDETGPDAVFPEPEWPAVKVAIESDPDLAEDWDLAVSIVRTDKLVQAMIAARKYDDATVDRILVRANALAA